MREFTLKNNIKTCIKVNKNTPRMALTLNVAINKPENYAGEYILLSRLLMKGTDKYSSEELSAILDENAIELCTEMKYDYLRFRFVSLNEDFELALSVMENIINGSTFEEFEKERIKLKGELLAELDSAKVKISDLFTSTIYKNHYYGNSYSKILEEIDNTSIERIKNVYSEIMNNSRKTIVVVGDIDEYTAENMLEKYMGKVLPSGDLESEIEIPDNNGQQYVEIIKDDAQQAQILQGWHVASINSEDYPKLMLLNIILGASGLSSRLFLELREKKGLAYTVRTSYDVHLKKSVFSIYIGTEPSNIQTSIEGFNIEIDKIKNILISEEELRNAKNNLIGKQMFLTETNSQQANLMAYYSIMGYDYNYQSKLRELLNKVTPEEIMECAKKYFNDNYVIAVIKP